MKTKLEDNTLDIELIKGRVRKVNSFHTPKRLLTTHQSIRAFFRRRNSYPENLEKIKAALDDDTVFENIKKLSKERSELLKQNENLRNKYGELEMKVLENKGADKIKMENAKLVEEITRIKAENEKEEQKHAEVEKEYEEFRRTIDSEMNKVSEDHQKKLHTIESQLTLAENTTTKLEKTLNDLTKQKTSLEQGYIQTKQTSIDSREQLLEKTKEVLEYEALQKVNKDLKNELDELKKLYSDNKESIIHLRNKLIGISKIKEQNNELKDMLNKENLLLKFMLEKTRERDKEDSFKECNTIIEHYELSLLESKERLLQIKEKQKKYDAQIKNLKSNVEEEAGSQHSNEVTENDTGDEEVIQKYLLSSLKFI